MANAENQAGRYPPLIVIEPKVKRWRRNAPRIPLHDIPITKIRGGLKLVA